jgi:elongation factor G
MSLAPSFAWMEWRGHRLYLADTPGSDGLAHEQAVVISGVDGVVVVVDGTQGLELGARRALQEAARAGIPRVVAITHMDRPCDVGRLLDELEEAVSDAKIVPLQIPYRDDAGAFVGFIPLLELRLHRAAPDGSIVIEAPPERPRQVAERAWERAVESVALMQDQLLERYLEEFELTPEDVANGIRRASLAGQLVPVVYTSAAAGIGGDALLDTLLLAFPDPAARRPLWAIDGEGADVEVAPHRSSFVAQHMATRMDEKGGLYRVFRIWSGVPPARGTWTHGESGQTVRVQKLYDLRGPRSATARAVGPGAIVATWDPLSSRPGDTWTDGPRLVLGAPCAPPPMMAWLLDPGVGVAGERLARALHTLRELDPALELRADEVAGGPILGGASQDHLDRALELLHSRWGISARTSLPHVAYRESLLSSACGVEGVYRRMADGPLAEATVCRIDVLPQPADEEVRLIDRIDDFDLVKPFMSAMVEGFQRALRHGPLAGYPVVGVEIQCTGGELDVLQTTDEHFRVAGERAVRAALERGRTRLLEPWHWIEVRVPVEAVGTLLAELAARRGRIQGLEVNGGEARISGECPMRELRTFGPRLQALTGARGIFSSRPSHYDPVPASLLKEVLTTSPFKAVSGSA